MSTISIARKFGQGIVLDTSDGLFLIELESGASGADSKRIKVTGPDEIPVHRREVFEAIHPGQLRDELLAMRDKEARTPDSELCPAELEDVPEEVAKGRITNAWESKIEEE